MPPFKTPIRTGATVCSRCGEPFVVPHDALPLDDGYLVDLRCTNCSAQEFVVLADETIEDLDIALDRANAELRATLDLLELIDGIERIDNFTRALENDLILPEDF